MIYSLAIEASLDVIFVLNLIPLGFFSVAQFPLPSPPPPPVMGLVARFPRATLQLTFLANSPPPPPRLSRS